MKKLSVAAIVLSLMSAAPITQAIAAAAQTTQTISATDQKKIDAILAEVEVAAKAGDQALVAKLLASAVKANPDLAAKIVSAFSEKQAAANKVAGVAGKTIDVAAVLTSVRDAVGSDPKLFAALSTAIETAAGGGNITNPNQNNNKPDPTPLPIPNRIETSPK